uniref:ATP-dependent DNA helicase n=1 Tax=Octopus bimaculoides TaxID=37653 RepID=A0A0L8HWS4_OCTBM
MSFLETGIGLVSRDKDVVSRDKDVVSRDRDRHKARNFGGGGQSIRSISVRKQKGIAVAVPLSGFAATILPGQTAHSAFKLPQNLVTSDSPICNISKDSGSAEVLCQYHLIIWDECTMSHRGAMEALGKTLQDIRGNNKSTGETLPVILKQTRSDEINAIIKSSHLWNKVLKFCFNTKVRASLHGDQCAKHFSIWLLQLGNGKILFDGNRDISLTHVAIMVNPLAEYKNKILPDLSNNYNSHKWLCKREILTPKNETLARINHELMNTIPTSCPLPNRTL